MVKLINRKQVHGLPLRLKEVAAPATPPAGFVEVYAKADGYLYSKDDTGVEIQVGAVYPQRGSNGSAGAPTFSYGNDTDSGWYLSAVGDMRAAVAGADKIILTDDGINGSVNLDSRGNGSVYIKKGGTTKLSFFNAFTQSEQPIRFPEQVAPATPAVDTMYVYGKTDAHFYSKNDGGLESRLSNFVVCTSSTRPASPVDGMQIYETDTFKTYIYIASKTGWFPPWNTKWGMLTGGVHRLTANSSGYTASGNSDMVLTNMDVRNDRNYRVHLTTGVTVSPSAVWTLDLSAGGTNIDRFFLVNTTYTFGEHASASCLYQPATTALTTLRVAVGEVTGTATLTINAGATTPRTFWIEDIGPR